MKSSNRRSVIVGFFVFFALAILVAGVLILGGQKKSFVKAIRINAVFKDVNGLAVGNNVWFSGVKIGTIKHISFDNTANVVVEMSVEERVRQYIRTDAMAKISSDGLIGNKIVVIYGGTQQAPVVTENATLKVENAASSEEMLATLQANNKNLLTITDNIKVISEKVVSGEGSLGKLLNDETLYRDLASTMNTLKQTASHAKSVGDDLSGFTSKLNEKGTLASDLVSDTIIFSRLRAASAEIGQMVNRSNEMVNQLSTAVAQVNDPTTPVGTLLSDRRFATDLKSTMENLESASYRLDENMEALQHNFLFRGYFRRKAKQENKGK